MGDYVVMFLMGLFCCFRVIYLVEPYYLCFEWLWGRY